MVASSRDVAAYFGKTHFNVLADIRQVIESLSPEISGQWFLPTETDVRVGFGTRKDPGYDMTRDGFTLLVMGYTGEKAMGFKVRYIEEFNRMEEELQKLAQPSIPTDYASALRLAADEHEKRLKLEAKVAEDAPKVESWNTFRNTDASITTGNAIITLHEIDGEPLVLDTDLGRELGMVRPTNIRQTIEANREELEGYGPCTSRVHAHPTVPGRFVTAYYLSEEQALILCMFSGAEKAKEIRRQIIAVYQAWPHWTIGSTRCRS